MTIHTPDDDAHRAWCLENREAAILKVLRLAGRPVNTATLSAATGLTEPEMRLVRRRLAARGQIAYHRRRGYALTVPA